MAKAMTKTELVAKIAERTCLTQKDAKTALEAAIAVIDETLSAGGKVQLAGLGTFDVKTRAARTFPNPQNRELSIHAPETKVPVFRAAASLKASVK